MSKKPVIHRLIHISDFETGMNFAGAGMAWNCPLREAVTLHSVCSGAVPGGISETLTLFFFHGILLNIQNERPAVLAAFLKK